MRGTPPGGHPQLYLRSLSARAFAPVPATENAGLQPFWSPDSQWIAFEADGKLMKWNVTAGQPPQIVCNADAGFGSWSEDGVILFSRGRQTHPAQYRPRAGCRAMRWNWMRRSESNPKSLRISCPAGKRSCSEQW